VTSIAAVSSDRMRSSYVDDLLDERDLEVQARLFDHLSDLTELQHEGPFAFVDHEDRAEQDGDRQNEQPGSGM
jgi:hypothetical protein